MGRGKDLSTEEMAKISAYRESGLSVREISRRINRSICVIHNFLKQGNNYGKNRVVGQNKKITDYQKRLILREIRRRDTNCTEIHRNLSLPISVRRVRQIVQKDPNLKFEKCLKKPPLTSAHRSARLEFARNYMSWTSEWERVIFSDEKKFNLDGPDGFHYYWHDLRKQKDVKMSRNFGGGSVMIWAAFCAQGKSKIAWLPKKFNSAMYIEMLDDILIDMSEELFEEQFIFQHDNASIHSAKIVKQWFIDRKIDVLNWPARSPDLNPVENLWGLLSRKVYLNGRQFNNITELKNEIRQAWSSIKLEQLKNLISSMPARLFEVIRHNGGGTHY